MTSPPWWIVLLLSWLLGLWAGTAGMWLVLSQAFSDRMSARHRAWRAITWLPAWIWLLVWRRP